MAKSEPHRLAEIMSAAENNDVDLLLAVESAPRIQQIVGKRPMNDVRLSALRAARRGGDGGGAGL